MKALESPLLTAMHTPKLFVQNIPQNTCKPHIYIIFALYQIRTMKRNNHENTHITCI
jgi:hypothetical protein